MKIQITPEPRHGNARTRTDDELRGERRLADQIGSDLFFSTPGVAFRLRQAREQSDFQLAEEREESDRDLLRERNARNAAVAALADREDLLAVFGHDMKSLLSVLSMHAELAAGQSQGGSGGLENVQRAARQMDRLISNLLDHARLRAGKFSLVVDKSNAAEIVEEGVDVFRPLASIRSLSLLAELPGKDLPVRVDPPRIFQVLSNLFSNAIKITPRGGQISVSAARKKSQVQIAVRDTGRGIAPIDLERIFDPYCQIGRDQRHGLGLGLFISKSIVQAHGGRIWAKSRLGAGSTFFFTVPADGFRAGKTVTAEARAS
jgi:signal transduction histidine kinase